MRLCRVNVPVVLRNHPIIPLGSFEQLATASVATNGGERESIHISRFRFGFCLVPPNQVTTRTETSNGEKPFLLLYNELAHHHASN